jgi:hypothetical protein
MIKNFTLLIIVFSLSLGLNAQNEGGLSASSFGKAVYVKEIPAISTWESIPAPEVGKEAPEKRQGSNFIVPGKGVPVGNDPLWIKQTKAAKRSSIEPLLTFDAHNSGILNDPTAAVGPNHFINSYNVGFRIFDKLGNPLTNEASLSTLFPGETLGDPIVVYDRYADRFIIMEFSETPNGILIAICQGSDPVNDGWYTYRFNMNAFPDYEKISIWSDAYYITANKSQNSPSTSDVVFALERDKMILGETDAQIVGFPLPGVKNSGFYSPGGFNAIGATLPPAGNAPIVYFQDDSWSGISQDHLKIWNINVDWTDLSASTISTPQELPTVPFDNVFDGGSFSNLPQPSGQDIDALQGTAMYMTNYRRFSDHNSAVLNFVVDLDGNDDHAGIRWYELRQENDGDPWTIYQEGTYSQPDGHSAFCGSISMDEQGNIGLGFTIVSETIFPSIRFTGRMVNDPLGTMTIEEGVLGDGNSKDPSYRYGDYAQLTIDPNDDKTFWHIGEYFNNNSRTSRVGVFKIASDYSKDMGVASIDSPTNGELSDAEDIIITITNFGDEAQTDIPVSYKIDDGMFVDEVYNGTIAPGESKQYTFSAAANLSTIGHTYSIVAKTALTDDENTANDALTVEVTYLNANDIGITEVLNPTSGIGLSGTEDVTVVINNFGSADQSNFDISYNLDGTIVNEQVAGPLNGAGSLTYTFNQTADFANVGAYNLSVYTNLTGDSDNSNDTLNTVVLNKTCEPGANCTFGGGFQMFKLGTIENASDCSDNGYGDYTSLMTELERSSTNDLEITSGYGDQYVRVWIDFNDNFVFEIEELVIDNYLMAEGQGSGTYTETIPLSIPANANLGQHMMRAKSSLGSYVPDDACEESLYGETEDYMTEIVVLTGVDEIPLSQSEMNIVSLGNNQFEVNLLSSKIKETLTINLHNILGQNLVQNRIENINGKYSYHLDMSFAKPGIYIVRLGDTKYGKVKRIVVE